MHEEVFQLLSSAGIEYGYLIPTKNGLDHYIMDATAPLRSYFLSTNYHDYSEQPREPGSKVVLDALYFGRADRHKTKVSLYRPKTSGDPRIWFAGLNNYTDPEDLLILTLFDDVLHVFNATQCDVAQALKNSSSFLFALSNQEMAISHDAELLMSSLKDIYNEGFIPSMRTGDTGVGFTLESLLGIAANSSQNPDIFGIEIKSGRLINGHTRPKSQIFAKTPDWKLSPYGAWETMIKFGYPRGKDNPEDLYANYCLRCTVDSTSENPQGFILDVRMDEAELWAKNLNTDEDVFVWGMAQLKRQFLHKHAETFWVGAESQKSPDGIEQFKYSRVLHTKKPSASSLERLLSDGGVTVDFTMSAKKQAKCKVRDHGYLFKVKTKRFTELFPVIQDVSLAD